MLLQQLSTELDSKNYPRVFSLLSSLAHEHLDFRTCTELAELWSAIPDDVKGARTRTTVRIAFISSVTIDHLLPTLELFLGLKHIHAEFWTSGYQIDAISHSRDASLENFKPDICILQIDPGDIRHWPQLAGEEETYLAALRGETSRWADIRNALKDWLGCEVIQDSIPQLHKRPLGALESRVRGGKTRFINDLNAAMLQSLPDNVRWHDVAALAASTGGKGWRDIRLWHHAKFGISPDAAPSYCFSLAAFIGANYGATKKCLVLDLDNTLWGGVIGDDGHRGLVFGEGSGDGEAFKEFQTYAKYLKSQGVLLAVCSKNDLAIAKSGFEKIAESVLRVEDFDAFIANWDRKSDNLQTIAQQLNIGIASLVFFDDNPAEREEVRFAHPDVLVIDVPDDPASYATVLDAYHAFEPAALTKEDLERSDFYKSELAREEFSASVTSYEDYLVSLQMEANIEPFNAEELPRIAQLINKTNQFNLTTRRYNETECEKFLDESRYLTRYVRLKDRFGNSGRISVFIAVLFREEKKLQVDTWLMSCRVLKRGVEQALFSHVLQECEKSGVQIIGGTYRATKSNGIVKSLFADFGFDSVGSIQEEETHWRLPRPFTPLKTFITITS